MKRLFLILCLIASACSTPLTTRERGALIGGGGGAGLGALLGGGTGALIGGAAGALGGGLIGDQFQKHEKTNRRQQYEIDRLRRNQRYRDRNPYWRRHNED